MKKYGAICLLGLAATGLAPVASGAIDGLVMNVTTGKVQPNVSLSLVQPGGGGMQTLATATSDEQGKFRFDKDPNGFALIQSTYKDVTYTNILQPGAPTNGIQVSVYDTTTEPSASRLSQHIIVLEPSAEGLSVSEAFLLNNDTNATFRDDAKGSVQVYVPGEPQNLQATIEGTAGMSIRRPLEKTSQKGVYKLTYPVKPGEERFDVNYSLPASKTYEGKLLRTDGPTRVVTPSPVTLQSDALKNLGQEPRTQAHIYEVTLTKPGALFKADIDGFGSLQAQNDSQQKEDDGSPQATVIDARVYTRVWWVLGLAFGILAVGGMLLYRRGAA